MVLQQNSDEKIWGWCDPGEKIKINSGWDTASYNTIGNSDGKWILSIKTPAAGGPYTLTINGSNKIVLEDILDRRSLGLQWPKQYGNELQLGYKTIYCRCRECYQ